MLLGGIKMRTSESCEELRRLNGLSLDNDFIEDVFRKQIMDLPLKR